MWGKLFWGFQKKQGASQEAPCVVLTSLRLINHENECGFWVLVVRIVFYRTRGHPEGEGSRKSRRLVSGIRCHDEGCPRWVFSIELDGPVPRIVKLVYRDDRCTHHGDGLAHPNWKTWVGSWLASRTFSMAFTRSPKPGILGMTSRSMSAGFSPQRTSCRKMRAIAVEVASAVPRS